MITYDKKSEQKFLINKEIEIVSLKYLY
jgi:hypothetical protein